MPTVPQPEITDVARKDRAKLLSLLHERECLSYAFSYKKLVKALSNLVDEEDALALLKGCIVATTEDEEREVKKQLNEEISIILTNNDIPGVRSSDPWGRRMDCVIYESNSSSFSKTKAIQIAPSLGVSTEKMMAIIEKATEKKSYVAVAVRPVKEGDGEEKKGK